MNPNIKIGSVWKYSAYNRKLGSGEYFVVASFESRKFYDVRVFRLKDLSQDKFSSGCRVFNAKENLVPPDEARRLIITALQDFACRKLVELTHEV